VAARMAENYGGLGMGMGVAYLVFRDGGCHGFVDEGCILDGFVDEGVIWISSNKIRQRLEFLGPSFFFLRDSWPIKFQIGIIVTSSLKKKNHSHQREVVAVSFPIAVLSKSSFSSALPSLPLLKASILPLFNPFLATCRIACIQLQI